MICPQISVSFRIDSCSIKNGPNNVSWFFTSRLKCKILLLWSGVYFGSHRSGPANFWSAADSSLPAWGSDPNWAIIGVSTPKLSLIRLSRPKWPLTTIPGPKWPPIRPSRPRWFLIRMFPDHALDQKVILVWNVWSEVIPVCKVW